MVDSRTCRTWDIRFPIGRLHHLVMESENGQESILRGWLENQDRNVWNLKESSKAKEYFVAQREEILAGVLDFDSKMVSTNPTAS